ncbi:DUF5592 family protein [Metabacillus niabensis]|uniref:DUF5592 family protein n=1 Tax=Metabacillus niabensis TaxID=324854 RepID=UPI00399EF360
MRRTIRVPEEIQANSKWSKLTVLDGIIIVASLGVGWFTKFIVHPFLAIPYVALFPITLYILLLPSINVPGKKNYQTAIQVLTKDRKVYKSISLEEIDFYRSEGEQK